MTTTTAESSTNAATVQLTISLYLVGLAVSQLALGPLSDRFGRRPVVLGGLAVTAASSVIAVLAANIEAIVAARARGTLEDVAVDEFHAKLNGTSMATPHVAGVAALLASKNQRLKGRTLRNELLARAVAKACPANDQNCKGTPENNTFYGHGLADALAAAQ